MKYIVKYVRPFFGRMGVGLAIKIGGTVSELFIPYILSHIIDNIVPLESIGLIVKWGAIMILCAVLAVVMNIVANRFHRAKNLLLSVWLSVQIQKLLLLNRLKK